MKKLKNNFIYKLLCIVKKCREQGKFNIALNILNKYKLQQVGQNYYD